MRKFRETLRSGEAFALKQMPAADIMSLLCDLPVPNEEIEGGIVVHIRGPLEHHLAGADENYPYGMSESYDGVYKRFCEAVHDTDGCIVIKIDSPGGLVSGLNETVYAMQEEAREHGVDVIVYVDELAASAAYAMACVGDEIVVPPSGIVGSVGVISAMTSVAKANEKAGIDVVTLTSGERKADGHPDVAISDEAIAAEQARVDDLAKQFFALVKESRGIDAQKFEAGLFLGAKAVKAGLADRVANWPQLLVDIAADYGSGTEVAQDGTTDVPSRAYEAPTMNLNALIARAEKALAAEKNPKKRQALMADIVAFRGALQAGTKKTYKKMEEQRTEESDDAEEEAEGGNETDREEEAEGGDDGGDEEDKKSKKASSKRRGQRAESGDDDGDEDDKKAESEEEEASAESEEEEASAESEEEEEEAIAALLGGLKGPRAQRAIGAFRAIAANARLGREAGAQVALLKAQNAKDKLHGEIDKKLAARFISKNEAQWLKKQTRATVEGFLKTRKGPIVLGDDDALTPPHAGTGIPVTQQSAEIGPQQMAVLEKVAQGSGVPIETLIKQYKPTLPNGIKTGGN